MPETAESGAGDSRSDRLSRVRELESVLSDEIESRLSEKNVIEDQWQASVWHWVAFIAIVFGIWWLTRRSSRSPSSSGHTANQSHGSVPDAEQLRRKRLEALSRSSSEQNANGCAETGEGLRQRSGAKDSSPCQPTSKSQAVNLSESRSPSIGGAQVLVEKQGLDNATEDPRCVQSEAVQTKLLGKVQIAQNEIKEDSTMLSKEEEVSASETTTLKSTLQERLPSVVSKDSALEVAVGEKEKLSIAESMATEETPFATQSQQACSIDAIPESSLLWVRAQGTFQGSVVAHRIEGLDGAMNVLDLEDAIATAFASGEDVKYRLFYLGKELKDRSKRLDSVGLKPGATVTITLSTRTSAGPPVVSSTAEATLSGGSAIPSEMAAPAESSQVTSSPADAWQAVLELEQQLNRANNDTEAPAVRQASATLRSMLETVVRDSTAAPFQMAQMMVPTLAIIWNFEPTQDYLKGLLSAAVSAEAPSSSDACSDTAASTAA